MPHVDSSILVVIQLFRSVPSCPHRKDVFFVIQICNSLRDSWMSSQPWQNYSKILHSNRWKAVLVLSSLKTYNINFTLSALFVRRLLDCFRQCFQDWYLTNLWFLKIYLKLEQVSLTNPFCGSVNCISDTGSDQRFGTERVWLVRLSQKFVSISKSRCSPL